MYTAVNTILNLNDYDMKIKEGISKYGALNL